MSKPQVVRGRVSDEIKVKIVEAAARFGPTESTIVRMALETFMPGYLASRAMRPENAEFFAAICIAIDARPELKDEIEKMVRPAARSRAGRMAA